MRAVVEYLGRRYLIDGQDVRAWDSVAQRYSLSGVTPEAGRVLLETPIHILEAMARRDAYLASTVLLPYSAAQREAYDADVAIVDRWTARAGQEAS